MAKQNDIQDDSISMQLLNQNIENLFNVYTDENNMYFYNILKTVNFPSDLTPSSYTTYSTLPSDTWPLIAYKYYNDVKLWWMVCAVNNIDNPIVQPKPGTVLKILNVSIVRSILTELKTS